MQNAPRHHKPARLYSLEPLPEAALRLGHLVARQHADLEQIAAVIGSDPELTQRLLRLANPRATSPQNFAVRTIEEALLRTGLGCALLLAMSQPLKAAIENTFAFMARIPLVSVDPAQLLPLRGLHLKGTIRFVGKAEGRVEFRISPYAARWLTGAVLAIPVREVRAPDIVSDTVAEMLNIVTGGFKSNLCNVGLSCRLDPPQVAETDEIHWSTAPQGCHEWMAFQAAAFKMFVALVVNPWAG